MTVFSLAPSDEERSLRNRFSRIAPMNLVGRSVSPVSSSLGVHKCWTGGTPILPRRFMERGGFDGIVTAHTFGNLTFAR